MTKTQNTISMNKESNNPQLYAQALLGKTAIWRGIVAVFSGLGILGLIFAFVLIPLADIIDSIIGKQSLSPDAPSFTIGFWLIGNLCLAALIPLAIVIERLLYGRTTPQLHSVTGNFRWNLFRRLAIVLAPLWAIFGVVMFLLLGRPLVFTSITIPLLLVTLFTVPFQAAGEEYLYRGLISRAVGSQFTKTRIAIVAALGISGLLFVLSHVNPDPWSNLFFVAASVGLFFSAHVSRGLEAPVLIHALTNVSFFLPLVLTNSLDKFGAPQPPAVVLVGVVLMLAMPMIVSRVLRRVE
jgi:uncharacterized protein